MKNHVGKLDMVKLTHGAYRKMHAVREKVQMQRNLYQDLIWFPPNYKKTKMYYRITKMYVLEKLALRKSKNKREELIIGRFNGFFMELIASAG